jgi:Sec-independent protein translocase protein TatA
LFGLGPFELIILATLVVAIFGLGRVPKIAHKVGWLHGTLRRLKREYPWITKIPWLSRFL